MFILYKIKNHNLGIWKLFMDTEYQIKDKYHDYIKAKNSM